MQEVSVAFTSWPRSTTDEKIAYLQALAEELEINPISLLSNLRNQFSCLKTLTVTQQKKLQNGTISVGFCNDWQIPPDYKRACLQVLLFFSHWKTFLDDKENLYRSEELDRQELLRIENLATQQMQREWENTKLYINQTSETINRKSVTFNASRSYTFQVLNDYLQKSSFLWRCYLKPRGYPGDYSMMNRMYERVSYGDTIFERLMDCLGFEVRLVKTVPTRKDFIVNVLDKEIKKAYPNNFHILNIGAGPALEIEECLKNSTLNSSIKITLIDQDAAALNYAKQLIQPCIKNMNVKLALLNISLRNLISDSNLLSDIGNPHFIYSVGLFDYLTDDIARKLIVKCLEILKNNGSMIIGNAADNPNIRWIPEFLLNWRLIYRSDEEMLKLVENLDIPIFPQLSKDSSNTWHFLKINKKCP